MAKRAVGLIALFMLSFILSISSVASTTSLPLEQTVSRRQSIRSYTSENISSQQLLEVLWATYGHINGHMSVPRMGYDYSLIIFPVNETGSYRYIPENNSLVAHDLSVNKETIRPHNQDWPSDASVVLVVLWNQTKMDNEYFASAEAGCLVQNVYLAAASLNLGTCCVSAVDSEGLRNDLKLPSTLIPLLVMPLGYPTKPYPAAGPNYDLMTGNLPPVQYSELSFEDALKNMLFTRMWSAENLSLQELSQLLWAAYGYTNVTHETTYHRTTPSAYGIYPLAIFVSNATGTYQYLPETHSVVEVMYGDKRFDIADACAGQVWAADAPAIFLILYNSSYNNGNTGDGGTLPHEFIEVDAGAVIQQLILEASAWNLSANIISEGLEEWNGTAAQELRNITGSPSSLIPLYIVPISARARIPGDIDGDGNVGPLDLGIMGAAWNSFMGETNYNPNADIDGDGAIGPLDLGIMGAHWGDSARAKDTTPPPIGTPSQDPTSTSVEPYQNVTVTANITDTESGVREATLSYTTDEGQTWTNTTMINTANDLYEAQIPGFPTGTHVQYKIIAYDNADNSATEDNSGQYYMYTVIPEFQSFASMIFIIATSITVLAILKKKKEHAHKHQYNRETTQRWHMEH
jgi:nitroreductase